MVEQASADAASNIVNTILKVGTAAAAAYSDTNKMSLTSFGKSSIISSRVYIDGSISNDPVVTEILKVVHTLYCSLIMNALHLNTVIAGGRTVKELINVVSTEGYTEHANIAASFEAFGGKVSVEDVNNKTTMDANVVKEADYGLPTGKIIEITINTKGITTSQVVETTTRYENAIDDSDPDINASTIVDGKSGTTVTTKSGIPDTIKLTLIVQILPFIIPEAIATKIVNYHFIPSWSQRFIQWRTGEISFWGDLLGQIDLMNDKSKLNKADSTGVLFDMFVHKTQSQAKLFDNVNKSQSDKARNIANAVLILNAETLRQAKAESGIDLNNPNTRNAYFRSTYAMIIVIVDTMYNHVTIYFNGIDQGGVYTFDQMKTSAKKDIASDVVAIMAALNQSKAPRF